jgi:hypothetical protein
MNLPALATPMSAIASGKRSLKIGAPASSRFARTSTSSRRPAGFMAMGGVCPDANLIQRLRAPLSGRGGANFPLLRKREGGGFAWKRDAPLGVTPSSGRPQLVQKDGRPSGRPMPPFSLREKGGVRESDRISAGRAEKAIPRRHLACSRERDLAKGGVVR